MRSMAVAPPRPRKVRRPHPEPPVGSDKTYEGIRRTFDNLVPEDGQRAEIIEGSIVVSTAPSVRHSAVVNYLNRLLIKHLPEDLEVTQNVEIENPHNGDIYIPDLFVAPRRLWLDYAEVRRLPVEEVLLAIEVVSASNTERDRVSKHKGYGQCGIPYYLLVDAFHKEGVVRLFHEPRADGGYGESTDVEFGDPIHLPQPINVKVATAFFVPYYFTVTNERPDVAAHAQQAPETRPKDTHEHEKGNGHRSP